RGGVDLMVAMNPQTWDEDIAEIGAGGYLLYDNSKPMPRSRFRDDINIIGVPLTEICNATWSDPRQRQLFKNIMYVGALSALLDMDVASIEALVGEQYKGKEKLLAPNIQALHLGRDWVRAHLPHPIGLRVQRADAVGDRIFVEGNAAAALGCVYGGATVCAWYPITPSSSLAEAFQKYCQKYRVDEQGRARFAVIQAEDEIASIGMVVGAGWDGARACLRDHRRAGRVADERVHRPGVLRGDPGDDPQRAARRAVDRHAHPHPAVRRAGLRVRFARRYEARAAVPGRSARMLRVRRSF